MQKIIGLDIGSYSIKAVEILNKFKSYEISNFCENPIPHLDDVPPDELIPLCMEQLFKENDLQADRIITAMPGQYISSRVLSFNFSEPHKVAAAVFAEIEDAVPFDLSDMIVDHQILGQMDAKTVALVVMTKKTFLANFLEHLQRINIDPKLVDVDSLSFYNLSPHLPMTPGKCYGIVDVGHEKTSVCLVQDGVLRMFRSINLGGRYITEFLARDLEVTYNEAQEIKHRISRVFTLNEKDNFENNYENRVIDRITIASNTIIKDLGRTLYAFKTWEKAPIEGIFLSGGTSKIQKFDAYLSEHLDVPVIHLPIERSALKVNPDIAAKMPVMAQGISIGLRAVSSVKRHSQINLRKGEFAFSQDYASIFKAASVSLKTISFVMILLACSYMTKYFSYSRQIENLQETFVNALPADLKKKNQKSGLGFAKIARDAKVNLQDRIESKRSSAKGFVDLNSDSGALISLYKISANLPAEIKINVTEYKYESAPDGSGRIRLRIEADSFDTIAKFEASVKKIKGLNGVEEKSSETKPGSEIKMAVIEARYIPNFLEGSVQ
mgnify:CR=1 FL=1